MTTAILNRHDVDGFVQPRICFEAKIALKEDDLTLNEMQKGLARKRVEEERARFIDAHIPPYIAAKRAGKLIVLQLK